MRKKRGSILIYVMAIFAVLMIMGATLTTLTLQSMKNRKYYSNSRVNLYYSESGIDEAYGIAAKYVESASNDALNKTNIEIEGLIEVDKVNLVKLINLREKLINYPLKADEIVTIQSEINTIISQLVLFDEDGKLNKEKLNYKQKIHFGINYIGFFAENIDTNLENLFNDLEKDDVSSSIVVTEISRVKNIVNVIYNDLKVNKVLIESKPLSDSEKLLEIEGLLKSQVFNINITSTFKKEDIERIISTDFKVTIPDYGSKISFLSKYVIFPESPIWSKGIVVNKNLSVGEAELTVNGDVYVKGVEEDTANSISPEKAILLNSKDSKLIVKNGNVIASEGVKFNYSTANVNKKTGAEVTIGGSLYTKEILFNEGAQGGTLDVTGSIYVLDDCEINAKNSTLKVGDSYYGVSDGEGAADNERDNSSAIIINSEDLGDGGSTVNIGGKVYLAGTAYIKGLNNPAYNSDYAYQTGESMSIKGNYKAYTETLKESLLSSEGKDLKYELDKTMLDPLILATHYNKHQKWFAIYGEGENKEIYIGMGSKIKEKYEEMGWHSPYKININGFDSKEFQIDTKASLEPSEMSLINSDELDIQLIKTDGSKIDIEVPKLEENFEAFLSIDNKAVITMTPRGKLEDSFIGAYEVELNDARHGFDEFFEMSDGKVGNDVSVEIYNRDGSETHINLNLKSYSTNFEDFNVFDKSAYFAKFYEEDTEDTINNGESIQIGNTDNSIYTGAIISEKGALPSNYNGGTGATTETNIKVQQKKAVLKDKMFYMDIFEKKCFDGDDDSEDEIEELGIEAYKTLKHIGELEKQVEYVLTPNKLLDFEKIEKGREFKAPGLYISTLSGETELPNHIVKNNSYGIIICEGDVKLKKGFNFTGTIITLGNLSIEEGAKDTDKVIINYDDALVKRVVAMNYDKLIDVFKNEPGYELDKIKVEIYDNENEDSSTTSMPLTIEKWAVIK